VQVRDMLLVEVWRKEDLKVVEVNLNLISNLI
jgi:hypothetical protein